MTGGAVYAERGKTVFENCLFSDNSSYSAGHLTVGSLATVEIDASLFVNGYAATRGGAISNSGILSLKNCEFAENHTDLILEHPNLTKAGGAVYNIKTINMTNCTFYNNQSYKGGAIYSSENSQLQLNFCTLTNNSAEIGGGIYGLSKVNITNSPILRNTATQEAADIYSDTDLSISNTSNEIFETVFSEMELTPLGWYSDFSNNRFCGDVDETKIYETPLDEKNIISLIYIFEEDIIIDNNANTGNSDIEDSNITDTGNQDFGNEETNENLPDSNDMWNENDDSNDLPQDSNNKDKDSENIESGNNSNESEFDNTASDTAEEKSDNENSDDSLNVSDNDSPNTPDNTFNEPNDEYLNKPDNNLGESNDEDLNESDNNLDESNDENSDESNNNLDESNNEDLNNTNDNETVVPPNTNTEENNVGGGGNHHISNRPTGNSSNADESVDSTRKPLLDKTSTLYLQGYMDATNNPKDFITRGQMAQIIYRLSTPESREHFYTTDDYFTDIGDIRERDAINTLANANVIEGYNSQYRPQAYLTKAELATIAARFFDIKSSPSDFIDMLGHWAENYVNEFVSAGTIVNGEVFSPDMPVSYGQAIDFISHVLEYEGVV